MLNRSTLTIVSVDAAAGISLIGVSIALTISNEGYKSYSKTFISGGQGGIGSLSIENYLPEKYPPLIKSEFVCFIIIFNPQLIHLVTINEGLMKEKLDRIDIKKEDSNLYYAYQCGIISYSTF
jgi:hypothetical protein